MRWLTATAAVLLLVAGACGSDKPAKPGAERVRVVASFYPVAEAARQVGGSHVQVSNLTPVGAEPHDIELTPDDVDAIQDADVLLYVSGGLQPAIAAAAKQRDKPSVDVAAGSEALGPHFWLDPTRYASSVARVRDALVRADSAHESAYQAGAARYIERLKALDRDFATTLSTCTRRDLVTAHGAFDYLAARYGLVAHSITGVSPEAEASPKRLADLVDVIKAKRVTTVFYEELVPKDFADALAREARVRTAVLNPLEGLTRAETKRGADYVSVMRTNLATLAAALDCKVAS